MIGKKGRDVKVKSLPSEGERFSGWCREKRREKRRHVLGERRKLAR
jgi:hypothetical protein